MVCLQEREADYHEAREKLFGKQPNLSHAHGSSGSLKNAAANGSSGSLAARPASSGASAGAGYMAAVPPSVGDRGFNIVNPGRGMGRGRGAASAGAVAPEPAAAAAAAAAGPVAAGGGGGRGQQQQQRGGQGAAGGPKAVYRDKQRDAQDPDYRRGVDRWAWCLLCMYSCLVC
jgi:hypothetical protein